MAKVRDWMEVDGGRFNRCHDFYWIADGDPEIHVYEVTSHPYTYWEASRTMEARRADILVTDSQDLEECCWDAVQALKSGIKDEQAVTN